MDNLLLAASEDAGPVELIVIKDDKPVYRTSFEVEEGTVRRVRISSASKWLVAATLLTLVNDKQIALDDPIGKYLPQFKGSKAAITLRQLLSHTSGLPANSGFLKDKSLSLAQSVDSIAKKTPMDADPGTQFLFGNVSYQVAARLAEIVSGKDWETLFNEKIAQPCRMLNTDFGNQRSKNIGEGAYSTAADYSNFLVMILNKGIFQGKQALPKTLVDEMLKDQTAFLPEEKTPYRNVPAKKPVPYGLGVSIDRYMPYDSSATEVSSQGTKGFTPIVNFCKRTAIVYSFYTDLSDVQPVITETKAIIDYAFRDNCKDVSSKQEKTEEEKTATNPVLRKPAVSFRIDADSKVVLKLFDSLGNEVATLVNDVLGTGDYSIPVDDTRLSPGVYFYNLKINDHVETKKLTIKKPE